MTLTLRKNTNLVIGLVMVITVFGTTGSLRAGELGHYTPGVAGIRDFIVPEPGFYYAQYNVLYTADTIKDRDGKTVNSIGPIPLDTSVDSYAIVPTFIWSSPWKILGATYAAYIQTPIVNTRFQAQLDYGNIGLSMDESRWGFGDLYIRPLWLGWNTKHFSLSTAYGFYAPTGDYDSGEADNTGLGFFTHEFMAGMTWFPWEHQGTAVMLNGTYEIHHNQSGVDVTPGERFSLDWGVSQFLPVNKAQTLILELGVAGYSQWQVEKDSGRDVDPALNVKDEVHGIGGQLGLAYVPWDAAISFRYVTEYDAKARYEGDVLTLTIAKGF